MQDNQQGSLTSDDLQLDEGVVHQGDADSIVPEEEVGDAHLHRRDLAPVGGVVQLSFNFREVEDPESCLFYWPEIKWAL